VPYVAVKQYACLTPEQAQSRVAAEEKTDPLFDDLRAQFEQENPKELTGQASNDSENFLDDERASRRRVKPSLAQDDEDQGRRAGRPDARSGSARSRSSDSIRRPSSPYYPYY
jgi:hypothetical protein